jgi:NAD(P)-dependent dehydrogenase (short-subunit alcohol dehydrogenase family)
MGDLTSMNGKVCVVTGASSGIGKATALALARRGARVVLICRNKQKGEDAAREIQALAGREASDLMIADLSVQQQVRAVAAEYNNKYKQLDVLINNAGATFPKRVESPDGMEMTLAVNHLAPFLLTNLLLDRLKMTANSRVVNVNSDAHESGIIDFDDLQMQRRYPRGVGMQAYANAKLANLLTVFELARRLQESNVTVNALHPGYVATNIVTLEDATGPVRLLKPFWGLAMRFILTPEKGATTSVYLSCSPQVARTSGKYFERCLPALSSPRSRDREMQRRMWNVSEHLTSGYRSPNS